MDNNIVFIKTKKNKLKSEIFKKLIDKHGRNCLRRDGLFGWWPFLACVKETEDPAVIEYVLSLKSSYKDILNDIGFKKVGLRKIPVSQCLKHEFKPHSTCVYFKPHELITNSDELEKKAAEILGVN